MLAKAKDKSLDALMASPMEVMSACHMVVHKDQMLVTTKDSKNSTCWVLQKANRKELKFHYDAS
jgi:hypothetical protein